MNQDLKAFTENEKIYNEKKQGEKFDINQAVLQDMVNSKKNEEEALAKQNLIKSLEKGKIQQLQQTNFTNNINPTFNKENPITNPKFNLDFDTDHNKNNNNLNYNYNNKNNNNPRFQTKKKETNVIWHEQKINFLLNTEEKNKHFERNIPNNFFFKNNENMDESQIKQFNQFYFSLCKFIGKMKNFSFNILENNETEFTCEFKIFSEINKESFVLFQLKFYKSIDIEYFDYLPMQNTIKEESIFSKELEIVKEDFQKFLEKVFDFRINY